MERSVRVLTSMGFVAPVAILFVNDAVLKSAYPGLITGKLSDVAGLAAFAMFIIALLPPRMSSTAALLAGSFFMWFKSPMSAPAIASWNALPVFDIGRVVDYGDLVALAVLPIAVAYVRRVEGSALRLSALRRRAFVPAAIVALVTFSATSWQPDEEIYTFDPAANTFHLGMSPSQFALRLDETGLAHRARQRGGESLAYQIDIRATCMVARAILEPAAPGTRISLEHISDYCDDSEERDAEQVKRVFANVIAELGYTAEDDAPDLDIDKRHLYKGADARFTSATSLGEIALGLDRLELRHYAGGVRDAGLTYVVELAYGCLWGRIEASQSSDGTTFTLQEIADNCAGNNKRDRQGVRQIFVDVVADRLRLQAPQ